MKNSLFFLGFLVLFLQSCSIRNHQLVYVNEYQEPPFAENVINLFFDGSGLLYPDSDLRMEEFPKETSYLWNYYSTNQTDFLSIAKDYNLQLENNNSEAIEQLQEQIIARKVEEINVAAKEYEHLVFLVHGYNNTYRQNLYPYAFFKERIDGIVDGRVLFVQVFWDGLTDRNTKNVLANENLYFKRQSRLAQGLTHLGIWRQANYNSMFVGQQLGKVIGGIEKERIQLVTHSLGARVASTALFDLPLFEKPSKTELFDAKYRRMKINNDLPTQEISVGMIAPAMDGYSIFSHYFNEGINQETNYNFVVGWNENDLVLRKFNLKNDKAADKFGDTSFGAVRSDLDSVNELFDANKMQSRFNVVEFTTTLKGYEQFRHSPIYYLENPNFEKFINQLFE